MNYEIELKYKVNKLPLKFDRCLEIVQTYFKPKNNLDILIESFDNLDINTINTFRLRKIIENNNIKYYLTLKTKSVGIKRKEYEKEISIDTYNTLIQENIDSKVIKNRYIKYENNYIFEYDEYLNLKINLITLEVELEKENNLQEDKTKIEAILKENNIEYIDVTLDHRYKNTNIIKYFG
ncbi:CYTH domain-containing protein [bacterium]|nr:CYTH domain-containing protein [bacterium]